MAKKKNKISIEEIDKIAQEFIDSLSEEEKEALVQQVEDLGMVMKEKVTADDWANTRPQGVKCGSDRYYADLASRLMVTTVHMKFPDALPENFIRESAMTVAAYLEDLVSGFGVWDSIRNGFKEKYGFILPFFDCSHEEYLYDNVNIEDVKYLLWQTISRCGQERGIAYSPYTPLVDKVGELYYEIIEEEFERAPESVLMLNWIKKKFKNPGYQEMRDLASWLTLDNKLVALPDMYDYINEEANEFMDVVEMECPFEVAYYHTMVQTACSPYTGPLGEYAFDIISRMAKEKGLSEIVDNLKDCQRVSLTLFKIIDANKKFVTLLGSGGIEYKVAYNTFKEKYDLKAGNYYYGAIFRYGEYWHANGVATVLPTPKNPEEDILSTIPVQSMNPSMIKAAKRIIEQHGGRKIFYCKSESEMSEIMGVNPVDKKTKDRPEEKYGNYVLMLSEIDGPNVLADHAQCFKEKGNKFYDKKEAEEDDLGVIMTGRVASDVADYIVENKLLPDAQIYSSLGKRVGKKVVQDFLRFWLGFYRTDFA